MRFLILETREGTASNENGKVIVNTLICEGKPWKEISDAARERKADLIIIGTHGHTGLNHALSGSTAKGVAQVLVQRQQATRKQLLKQQFESTMEGRVCSSGLKAVQRQIQKRKDATYADNRRIGKLDNEAPVSVRA